MRQFSGLDLFRALLDVFPYHSWPLTTSDTGNASICAEKKSNPRIASCGKDTLKESLAQISQILKASLQITGTNAIVLNFSLSIHGQC